MTTAYAFENDLGPGLITPEQLHILGNVKPENVESRGFRAHLSNNHVFLWKDPRQTICHRLTGCARREGGW